MVDRLARGDAVAGRVGTVALAPKLAELPAPVTYLRLELVAKQVNGVYKVKHPDMKPLHARAQRLAAPGPAS